MHYPFDDGALAWLGEATNQKTIKAACGKRVAFADASAQGPITCEHCRRALDERIAGMRQVLHVGGEVERLGRAMIGMLTAVLAKGDAA